jgi:hypothetical protein
MARAFSFEALLAFLHGVVGSGILYPEAPNPPVQVSSERILNFPQIVGFHVEESDPQALEFLQVVGFVVETESYENA